MRRVIQTPNGPRGIPDWAKCYCVSRHMPIYLHPLPWELPDGTEMWLCPNTHHQVTTLWKMYEKVDGPPALGNHNPFALFAVRFCRFAWQMKMQIDSRELNPGIEIAAELKEDRERQKEYTRQIKKIREEYL